MEHTYLKHTNCQEINCMYCDGGLAFCTTCKAGEAELPTECPGVPMTHEQMRSVATGVLDYKGGEWLRTEMRPCPVCGRTDVVHHTSVAGIHWQYWVACRDADCVRGPMRGSQGEAIAAWNKKYDTINQHLNKVGKVTYEA